MRRVALKKKLQLEAKINAIKVMSIALSQLVKECSGDDRPLDEAPSFQNALPRMRGREKSDIGKKVIENAARL
jgi:hypothetical protein